VCQRAIAHDIALFCSFIDTQAKYEAKDVNHSVRIMLVDSPFGVI
jgi:hypothetical protein